MSQSIAIRRATPSDGFLVEGITRRIWTGRVSPESTVFRETPETVAAQIAKGGAVLLEADGALIGSGRWVAVPGPGGQGRWMEVKRIGVLPGFTGQGLGAHVLAALEAWGQEQGAKGAQLAIRADQPRLIGFYADLGYVRADDVDLTTHNPLSPPPFGMRKWFRAGEGAV
ncbi:GNAT family N-acetyltransferase [Hyphomonas sp. WL0036]|uniref:GNAT family N-acetyltransferase n=1 Tax=Hyphomonas sediminis TaxID=2866160 RepID=UPI001C80D3E8|nr:GNAT family N-acetyltransferase [Hyphomonas sediminis]MBY9065667.1 GNAT family N-acetyltransferase [Hyphomonas sediminis]